MPQGYHREIQGGTVSTPERAGTLFDRDPSPAIPRRASFSKENVMLKRLLGLTLFAVVLMAVLNAGPVRAASPAAPAVAAQPGCQPVLDLGKVLQSKGETCSATAAPRTQAPEPDFLIVRGRTCRCSCGFPCTTDADCGGGVGSCRAGITCC
jgi:hypothetical protein